MSKQWVNNVLSRFNLQLVSRCRMGLELEWDLARLCAGDGPNCILDVGANAGQTAIRFVKAFPQCRIYSFEPVPQTFQALRRNVAPFSAIEPIDQAMGAQRGHATIHLTGNSATSTMLATSSAGAGDVEVAVETVDAFCRDRKIERVDLLKIDVEGFETEVLKGAQQMLGEKLVRFVFAECDFSPNPRTPHGDFMKINEYLTQLGYSLAAFYPETLCLEYGSLHGNALFACRDLLPKKVRGGASCIV